jgi:hypothetical protein
MSVVSVARLGSMRQRQRGGGKFVPGVLTPVNYDFYVSPTGGTGAGTINDPWSLAYAVGPITAAPGASAQKDGKLLTTGARIAVRGGTGGTQVKYHIATNLTIACNGSVGSGVDNPDGKIIFEGYRSSLYAQPERACLFGDLVVPEVDFVTVDGNYIWLKDLEFARDWSTRDQSLFAGVAIYAHSTTNGLKVIHCDIHDSENGVYSEDGVGRMEIYGSWFRNIGLNANAGPGGHGVYLHHKNAATRLAVSENIFGSTFAFCMQIYFSGSYVEAIDLIGNITYNGYTLSSTSPRNWPRTGFNTVLGSETGGLDITCTDQMSYWPTGYGDSHFIAPYASSNNSMTLTRPYCVGGGESAGCLWLEGTFGTQTDFTLQDGFFRPDLTSTNGACVLVSQAGNPLSYTWTGNTWIRDPVSFSWIKGATARKWTGTNNFPSLSGLGGSDTATATDPALTKVFVRPTTRFDTGRGHVVIYNWELSANVFVDLSTILSNGHQYAVYDNRDPWNAIFTGTYDGSQVSFPMSTQVTDPTPLGGGLSTAPATVPFFNAFIVRRTG